MSSTLVALAPTRQGVSRLPYIRTRLIAAASVLLPGLPNALIAQSSPVSLEGVLGAPFAEQLVASPRGKAVAWVQSVRGARNVWVARAPEYSGHSVTSYAGDDGQEITELTWTPDGRSLVYVRGGEPNRAGEHPNPTHAVGGADQSVVIVPATGGSPRELAHGSGPAISPRGDVVAYNNGGQIWTVPIGPAAKPSAPTQLAQARGSAGHLRWSPNGSHLAFVSSRDRHDFIGVYDVSRKTVRYLDPSTDVDGDPVWSPDGSRVAFTRRPSTTDDMLFIPRRTGFPWSIRVAEVATGQGREVWRSRSGTGSVFRGVEAFDQLVWSAGDRIVFPWEGDGWTHLYSVPSRGGEATLLTPGSFEVEYVSHDASGKEILYSSNQIVAAGDDDRRHIWLVADDGGAPATAVTRGTGLEWGAVRVAEGGGVVTLHADARRPARVAVVTERGLTDVAPELMPRDFPADALVEPRRVVFRSTDGLPIHGQLFVPPPGVGLARRPAVLFFHGGSRRQMLLGWHYYYYYHNSYALNQYLASRGYVVLSVNYRSGIGYGMSFREALAYGAAGASELQDVIAAGRWLRARADVDSRRIGLWGGSYGGYLTALGLARASDLFSAGVDLHGVHDWNLEMTAFSPQYDSVRDADRGKVAYRSSPLAWVKQWRSPVLLIHGDDDRNVPFTESVYLAEALRKHGVEFEELVFPDDVHDFLLWHNWLAAYRAAADFLDRKLSSDRPRTAVSAP